MTVLLGMLAAFLLVLVLAGWIADRLSPERRDAERRNHVRRP